MTPLIAITLFTLSLAQPINFAQNLEPESVKEDIRLLKTMLEEAQTGLYRYSTRAEIDEVFEETLAQDSLSYLEFVGAVARIQNTIACGHSGWEHPAEFRVYRNAQMHFFPMDIAIADARYYIRRNMAPEDSIAHFTEITHINGRAVSEITRILKRHMQRDGQSNPACVLEIEQHFRMAYSNFIGNPDVFHLSIREGEQEAVREVSVAPLLLSQIDSVKQIRYGTEPGMGIPLRLNTIDSISTAVYTIKWFRNEYIRSLGQEFRSFTDSVFRHLADHEIENLIIDLRGNVGGWTTNGGYLFAHFIDEPTGYIKRVTVKKYRDYSFESHTISPPGYADTMNLELRNDSLYEWVNYPSRAEQPAKKNRFRGCVYILTDGLTRSASSIFCSLMNEHTDAVFVGEETAAAQNGTNGMVMSVRLPYSGLIVHFSTACYHFDIDDSTNTGGIVPDIEVLPTVESIQSGRDLPMDTICNRIHNILK